MKNKLSKKEWLFLSLSFFIALMVFLAGLGMDAGHTVFAKGNIFEGFAELFQIPKITAHAGIWIMLLLFSIAIITASVAILYVRRYLIKHDKNPNSFVSWLYYIGLFIASFALMLVIGTLFQIPNGRIETYGSTLTYVFGALVIGVLLFAIIAVFFWALIGTLLYIYQPTVHPSKPIVDVKKDYDEKEEKITNDEPLKNTLLGNNNPTSNSNFTPINTGSSLFNNGVIASKEKVFTNLVAIDEEGPMKFFDENKEKITLKDLVNNLQIYLANVHNLYYNKNELAQFIAGMNASKLIILEGISGTGKSSLPRYFAKFIGEDAFFEPIQVTYKEKSDLLGYYNELTGRYVETNFLKELYRASLNTERLNLMVLDEMNISRIEYYFADFLSVMEFPENERQIPIMSLPSDYDAPINLKDGILNITPNTYFIGTANKDDSTFTITDKVIDRAIVIDFEDTQIEAKYDKNITPINLSYDELHNLFNEALKTNPFKAKDRDVFLGLLKFINEELGIVSGNRLIKQIDLMVPIYNAMEIDYTVCLDYFLANKILRKLDVVYDSSLKNQLTKLLKKIDELYLKDQFLYSKRLITRFIRRIS